MEEILITFNDAINVSLQVGDIVYYNSPTGAVRVGPVSAINREDNTVQVTRSLEVPAPSANDFIFFVKDRTIESSGIIGYEATTTMVNTSTRKAELFAVSTEVFESSR